MTLKEIAEQLDQVAIAMASEVPDARAETAAVAQRAYVLGLASAAVLQLADRIWAAAGKPRVGVVVEGQIVWTEGSQR